MKGILRVVKMFQKIDENGTKIFEEREDIIDDRQGNIFRGKQQIIFRCSRCGRPMDNRVETKNCPLCGRCCLWCHREREKNFERLLKLEEHRQSWLAHPALDHIPGIRFYRQYKAFSSVKRIEESQRKLIEE